MENTAQFFNKNRKQQREGTSVKDCLKALQIIAPAGHKAAQRNTTKYQLEQKNLSPEKRYINQRLNIKMFYTEQLSVQPKDSIEMSKEGQVNREKPIRDIVEETLKLNYIQTAENTSKVVTTNNVNTNSDKSPKAEVPGFKAEVKSSPYFPQADSSHSYIMNPISKYDTSRTNNPY